MTERPPARPLSPSALVDSRLEWEVKHLRRQARECRDLAATALTESARDILSELASNFEITADEMERLLGPRS